MSRVFYRLIGQAIALNRHMQCTVVHRLDVFGALVPFFDYLSTVDANPMFNLTG